MQNAQEIVTRVTKNLWGEGRTEIVDQHYTSDYVNHNPMPGIPGNREGEKRAVEIFRAGFPDLHTKVRGSFTEGDQVCVMWTAMGTHSGEFMGIPPTNKHVETEGISVYRVQDGKVVEEWGQVDMLGMLQQVGVIPEMQIPAGSR